MEDLGAILVVVCMLIVFAYAMMVKKTAPEAYGEPPGTEPAPTWSRVSLFPPSDARLAMPAADPVWRGRGGLYERAGHVGIDTDVSAVRFMACDCGFDCGHGYLQRDSAGQIHRYKDRTSRTCLCHGRALQSGVPLPRHKNCYCAGDCDCEGEIDYDPSHLHGGGAAPDVPYVSYETDDFRASTASGVIRSMELSA